MVSASDAHTHSHSENNKWKSHKCAFSHNGTEHRVDTIIFIWWIHTLFSEEKKIGFIRVYSKREKILVRKKVSIKECIHIRFPLRCSSLLRRAYAAHDDDDDVFNGIPYACLLKLNTIKMICCYKSTAHFSFRAYIARSNALGEIKLLFF